MSLPLPPPPPHIELAGSPREIGLEHGKQLAVQIRRQIQVYSAMFQRTSNLDWQAVRNISVAYQNTIRFLAPDIYDEMEGIAEGANLSILDIVALNARSEIALGLFSDGCTSLGWKLGGIGYGDVILAQNWDWTPRIQENLAMMSIDQPGHPKIYMIAEAGIVGKIGFNSASVGVCLNAIRAHPTDASKLPIHVALRLCLQSTSTQNAIERITSLGGVASSQHILIADRSGALAMELSPLGDAYIPPNERGYVVHTNHFIANKCGVTEPHWPGVGSHERLARINELMKQVEGEVGAGLADGDGEFRHTLRHEIFSDTFNSPASICCMENPVKPIETRSRTLFCIMMKFSSGAAPSAEVVWGNDLAGPVPEGHILQMPWV
ncbi:acyl-coenzyme A:6-aminopenicillanic acid acyl-transferase-domain-containing protein [Mycena alexandri]|uniref:Acyl-coenzyme A:6-aminopenicillanic acid acyl-transferase-domain-containing protein n=1 Tax=Mycena alexandri TaxID=1745969 RepID=A0AAD6TI28_9AGAR|nr:acyl-coenzyme A:6-aminopenicillanic acid acyl-transferase-domain-containing protein [Mycena alexandri]KAJ7045310.1 acyl-coenzyme A:6-aminopenicillanic acid acyl-transferase-domain-containing protein [Mycena alexandri]